jgi:hypothetical protein
MVVKKGKRSKKIVRNSKKRSVKKGGKRSSRRSKSIISKKVSKKVSKKGGADADPGVASAAGTPREGASALPHQQLAAWMAQNAYTSQPPQQLQYNQPPVTIHLE